MSDHAAAKTLPGQSGNALDKWWDPSNANEVLWTTECLFTTSVNQFTILLMPLNLCTSVNGMAHSDKEGQKKQFKLPQG